MGLRFRRSVKLCKGVRLNFGKTGASISVGGNGIRKTFHTSGKVTTSVGIPGTGIYWTESTNKNKRNNRNRQDNSHNRNSDNIFNDNINEFENDIYNEDNCIVNNYDDFSDLDIDHETKDSDSSLSTKFNKINSNIKDKCTDKQINPNELIKRIKELAQKSDIYIDWSEISFSSSNDDVLLDKDMWDYCKNKADDILDGNIDAYLDVIEYIKPLDDLLLYAGDFEFGTNDSNIMYVEINILLDNINNLININKLFEEYTATISIKVSKDLLSLLPVTYVHVKTLYENKTLFDFQIDRKKLAKIRYDIDFSITDFIRLYLK